MKKFGKLFAILAIALMAASAQATVYDLTNPGAVETVNGAIYMQWDEPQPMGTGVIDAFLRIQGSTHDAQHGYNTNGTPLEFDTKPGTHALLLSDIPTVRLGGINYREFLLDINQDNKAYILSLDKLKIHTASVGNLTGYLTNPAFGAPIYDLDAGGDNSVNLDDKWGAGSGKGDMLLFVPDSAFTGAGAYIYLYSMLGDTRNGSDGFEEWAVGDGGAIIPEPATMILLSLGGLLLRKRTA